MVNDLLSQIFENQHDFIYRLISCQDLKLCLDIGAAAGLVTRKIKEMGDQETKVIAFEPFPGNHQYFVENTKDLTNIELITKAVSDTIGHQSFYVSSVVSGQESGWENLPGYSSLGHLLQDSQNINGKKQKESISNFLRENLRSFKKYIKKYILNKEEIKSQQQSQILNVDKITLDSIVKDHVDFCKIDVQGGEFDVLKGAENLIKTQGIDVIYLEYSGDLSIRFSKSDFNTSLQSITNQLGYIQTDLVCVNKLFLRKFIQNVSQLIKEDVSIF